MNQDHLIELFKAWEVIEGAESALGDFLYGAEPSTDSLHDLLGELIDRNLALSGVLGELLGAPVEDVREAVLQGLRDAALGSRKQEV